jgi:4-amino-4-deoxy-L-arabinose transferase-like glycosyltransferase
MGSRRALIRAGWRTVANRRTLLLIAACAVLAAALRIPFIWTGISMDEGGYAYVAQQWARGARLYDTGAWLDRPQGLLLTYRFLLWWDDSGWTIRLGAAAAGFVIAILVGLIGWLIAGRRAALAAALIYSVVGVAPRIEGFTLNGELLASVPAAAAVAAALLWHRSGSTGWLIAAGLSAGAALTMKQSGVDGLGVGLAVVTVGAAYQRVRHAAIFLAAAAAPLGACALHGGYLGWQRYWTALVGYQLAALTDLNTGLSTRWDEFSRSLSPAGLDLLVVGSVAGIGLWLMRRSRIAVWMSLAWLTSGAIGVNMGGSYWPHYYVQLLPPLAVLAGTAVAAIGRPGLRAAVLALAVLPQLLWFVAVVGASPAERQHLVPYYARAARDERIAAVIRAETEPSDQIFVLVSEANLYFLTRRTTDYPYLWGKPIEKIPDALPCLREMLDGPERPALVVLNNEPDDIDPTGALARILVERYRVHSVVEGVTLLRTADSSP